MICVLFDQHTQGECVIVFGMNVFSLNRTNANDSVADFCQKRHTILFTSPLSSRSRNGIVRAQYSI